MKMLATEKENNDKQFLHKIRKNRIFKWRSLEKANEKKWKEQDKRKYDYIFKYLLLKQLVLSK